MAYILSSPDSGTNPEITLVAYDGGGNLVTGNLTITSLQDVTINNALDVFTWQQLDKNGKFQVPTTSTNSITTTLVVDTDLFFGTNASAVSGDTAAEFGLLGLSDGKILSKLSINMGASKTITANCYVTGLSPTVSADNPVWTTPVTFSVDGDYKWS